MASPRKKLLESKSITICNTEQYKEVLSEIKAAKLDPIAPEERMYAVFGVLTENSLETRHIETLPKECYRWHEESDMGIDIEKFETYRALRTKELSKTYGPIELLGHGHMHSSSPEASTKDIEFLPSLGLELICMINYTENHTLYDAKIYAPWCETPKIIDGNRYNPVLREVKYVKIKFHSDV